MAFRFFMWNRQQEDKPSRANCDGKAQILPQFKELQRATRKSRPDTFAWNNTNKKSLENV